MMTGHRLMTVVLLVATHGLSLRAGWAYGLGLMSAALLAELLALVAVSFLLEEVGPNERR